MIAALLVAVLGATPSILVVPTSGPSRTACEELLEVFIQEGVRVKLAGEKSQAVACMARPAGESRRACLVDALQDARVDAVLLVTAPARGATPTVGLQLLSRAAEPLRREAIKGPRARLVKLSRPAVTRSIAALRAQLRAEERAAAAAVKLAAPEQAPVAIAPPPVAPPRDAPTAEVVTLTPQPAPARLELGELAPVRVKPRGAAWTMTALAIAGAGVAGTFGTLGFVGKGRLEQVPGGVSPLSYTQAQAVRDDSNTQLTVALAGGITAGVAAVIAGVLWAQ